HFVSLFPRLAGRGKGRTVNVGAAPAALTRVRREWRAAGSHGSSAGRCPRFGLIFGKLPQPALRTFYACWGRLGLIFSRRMILAFASFPLGHLTTDRAK